MKKILCLSTLLLAAAMLADGCSRGKNSAGSPVVPVLVARAVETNVPVQIDPPPVGHGDADFNGDGPFSDRRYIK